MLYLHFSLICVFNERSQFFQGLFSDSALQIYKSRQTISNCDVLVFDKRKRKSRVFAFEIFVGCKLEFIVKVEANFFSKLLDVFRGILGIDGKVGRSLVLQT